MPPEAISQNSSYSFEFDWWSFGVLMHKMLTGVFPFESREPAELLYMIKYKDIDIMLDYNTERIVKLGEITPERWI